MTLSPLESQELLKSCPLCGGWLCNWKAKGKHEWSKNIQPNICRWQLKPQAELIFLSGRVAVSEEITTSSTSIWIVKQEEFCITRHLMPKNELWRILNLFCWKLFKLIYQYTKDTKAFPSENKSISQVKKYYMTLI